MALAPVGGLLARGHTNADWTTTTSLWQTTTSVETVTTLKTLTTTDVTTDTTTDVTTDYIKSIVTESIPYTVSYTKTVESVPPTVTVTITNVQTVTKSSTCPVSTFTITKTTSSTCAQAASTTYSADVYVYSPAPGVPPLATHYVSVYGGSTSLVSIFCNTQVFREYFRPSIFNCNCRIGPIQTLNSVCDIVVGPIFTTGCDDNGIFVTQTGPTGTVIDLGTTAIVSSCGTQSTKTIATTPIVYGASATGSAAASLSAAPISFGSTVATVTARHERRAASTVSTSGTVATVKTLISARGAQTSTSVL